MEIIITDSVKNMNALFRRRNAAGIAVHGKEAQTVEQIAWNLLLEHEAKSSSSQLPRKLSDSAAASLVLQLLQTKPGLQTFAPQESLCKAAAQEILVNVNLLRNTPHNGSSDSRVRELEAVRDAYETELKDQSRYDGTRVVLTVIDLLKNRKIKPSDTFSYLFFDKPIPESVKDFCTLLGAQEYSALPAASQNVKKEKIRCYGMANEIEYVCSDIVKNGYNPAECELIFTAEGYAPLLSMVCAKYRLPLMLENGEKASATDTAQLMQDLLSWQLQGTYYKDLFPICFNPKFCGFDEYNPSLFLEGIEYGVGFGEDRYRSVSYAPLNPAIAPDKEKARLRFAQELLPAFADLSRDLRTKSVKEALRVLRAFTGAHTQKRNSDNRYLTPVIAELQKDLDICDTVFPSETEALEYLRDTIAGLPISGGEAKGPALLAHSISGAHVSERKHLYCVGFSDKEFQISTAESPVLDDRLRECLFGANCRTIPFAKDNRQREEQKYLDTFSRFSGEDILLTASTCDTVEKGTALSASAFFENRTAPEWTERPEQTAYPNLIAQGVLIRRTDGWPTAHKTVTPQAKVTISKTTLDTLLSCPLKYNYEKQLHISQEEYTDDSPDRWLPPNERGTFIHKVLELYCKDVLLNKEAVNPTFDETIPAYRKAWNTAREEAEKKRPAPNVQIQKNELEEYQRILSDYLSRLHEDLAQNHWVVRECEKDIAGSLSDSLGNPPVTLEYSGIIDRIDSRKTEDGPEEYRIVDYKTGSLKSVEDSKQHKIYAEYVRTHYKTGNVSFAYIGLKENKEKNIPANDLSPILTDDEKKAVYNVLYKNDYSAAPAYTHDEGACQYCRYQDICFSRVKGD